MIWVLIAIDFNQKTAWAQAFFSGLVLNSSEKEFIKVIHSGWILLCEFLYLVGDDN